MSFFMGEEQFKGLPSQYRASFTAAHTTPFGPFVTNENLKW